MPERDKKAPVNKVTIEYINDFSGGLNTTINGSLLNKNEAQKADNVSFEQKGTLKPRRGRRKRYLAPFSNYPITGLGAYYKSDGTSRLIIPSGDKVSYDKPHISNKYDTQADFEKAGTSKTSWVNTSLTPGSLVFTGSLLGTPGDCEDVALWTAVGGTGALEPTKKVYGTNAIAFTLGEGSTVGSMRLTKSADFSFDTTKPLALGAWLANKDLETGIRLVAYKQDGTTVVKASDYVTATSMTWTQIKLTAAEVALVGFVAIECKGTATKKGYFDGVVAYPITTADYDNASYVMPKYDALMALTDINKTYQPSVPIEKGTPITQSENLSTGTLTAIQVLADGNITVDTNLTFEPYEAMTFDQLIAL